MNKVVLSIGSNSQDKNIQMTQALKWLSYNLNNCYQSSIYSTPSINGMGDDYVNAVIIGETELELSELTHLMKQYEKDSGRTPESKFKASIPIDIDVVIFNNVIIKKKDYNFNFFQIGYKELIGKSMI